MLYFNESIVYGHLVKRYKRFFMDVLLDNGDVVTAHTPNTGSMMGLLSPHNCVMLTKNSDPKRKTAFTTQAIEVDNSWVGVNTHLPNRLVRESLSHPLLEPFSGYQQVKAEVPYGQDLRSRIDLHFFGADQNQKLFVEIKNVTLKVGKSAQFPDSVSLRARKHIEDLLYVKKQGFNAALLFVVQRSDCEIFAPAREIDPVYADLLAHAHREKLAIRALVAKIDESGLRFTHELPCVFT